MLCRAIAAVLLFSGLYPEARAQNLDFRLPDGSVVHRHVMAPVQCLHVGHDPNAFDWMHDGPCGYDDFATVDASERITYREGMTTQQLEHILETYAQLKYGDRRLRTQIAAGRCMLIPTDEALPWFHSPPCRQGDIGEIMPGGHIAFRAVTNGQLEYAIALFIHGWSGLPIRMEQFPEYKEASHP
jgi:hypothetical protein